MNLVSIGPISVAFKEIGETKHRLAGAFSFSIRLAFCLQYLSLLRLANFEPFYSNNMLLSFFYKAEDSQLDLSAVEKEINEEESPKGQKFGKIVLGSQN